MEHSRYEDEYETHVKKFTELVKQETLSYIQRSMIDGSEVNKTMWCKAFITAEREGQFTQQAAESLNGAYDTLGIRDGLLVKIAERSVTRELKVMKKEKKLYEAFVAACEKAGPRIKLNLSINSHDCNNPLKYDVNLMGPG